MKRSLIFLAVVSTIGLTGCFGSFKKVVDSNDNRKTEHIKFQVNRLNTVDNCYVRANTDAKFQTCALLQMQIQTEQGFTVTAGQMALPETPEKQLKDGLVEGAKIVGGVRIGEKLIDGLNRPNDVLTTPDPIIVDREVPVFIQPTYPPASP